MIQIWSIQSGWSVILITLKNGVWEFGMRKREFLGQMHQTPRFGHSASFRNFLEGKTCGGGKKYPESPAILLAFWEIPDKFCPHTPKIFRKGHTVSSLFSFFDFGAFALENFFNAGYFMVKSYYRE